MREKAICCSSRADPRQWCHQRYWLMVKLLQFLIKQYTWDILYAQKIVKTLPCSLRTTSGNSLTCLLLILGSYTHLLK